MGKLGVPARLEPYRTQQGMSKYGAMLVQDISKLMDATTKPYEYKCSNGIDGK